MSFLCALLAAVFPQRCSAASWEIDFFAILDLRGKTCWAGLRFFLSSLMFFLTFGLLVLFCFMGLSRCVVFWELKANALRGVINRLPCDTKQVCSFSCVAISENERTAEKKTLYVCKRREAARMQVF